MDNRNKDVIKVKLEALNTELVKQIVFDALHMKRSKFPDMNVGQHSDYKDIYRELKEGYERSIEQLNQ